MTNRIKRGVSRVKKEFGSQYRKAKAGVKRIPQNIKKGYSTTDRISKKVGGSFKKITPGVSYSQKLSKTLLQYGGSGNIQPRQPTQKQILARQKFILQQRKIHEQIKQQKFLEQIQAQQRRQSQMQQSRQITKIQEQQRQIPVQQLRQVTPQYQRPQAKGVWSRDNNSWANSNMPLNTIWKHRRPYDIMENGKLKQGGMPGSFFN